MGRYIFKNSKTYNKIIFIQKIFNKEKEEDKTDKFIKCKQCLMRITNNSQRIDINGSHKHSFVNPNGVFFEIGCFKSASGLRYTGIPTNEFTWFQGYLWEIALCGKCLKHIGWRYTSYENNFFHGLILDYLVET